jgi:hypothetical protein
MRKGQHPSKLRSLQKNFNIIVLEYSDPNHADAIGMLKELEQLALSRRSNM